MEGKRLIVPRHPPHHHRRAVLMIAAGLLAVGGVWGVQMHVTFQEYAKARQSNSSSFAQVPDELKEGFSELAPSEETAVEIATFAEQLRAALEAAQQDEVAVTPIVETSPVTEGGVEGEPAAFPPALPQGIVAGEQTEASN